MTDTHDTHGWPKAVLVVISIGSGLVTFSFRACDCPSNARLRTNREDLKYADRITFESLGSNIFNSSLRDLRLPITALIAYIWLRWNNFLSWN